MQPFVHYNTVICIAVSILRLNFGQRLYFGLWQAETLLGSLMQGSMQQPAPSWNESLQELPWLPICF